MFIGHLRNVFTRLSLVKRAKGSGRGVTVYKVVCVCWGPRFSSSVARRRASVSHSPVEVEVPHVFGRFLRGTHLLIVEDDPPVWHRDIDAVTHTHTTRKKILRLVLLSILLVIQNTSENRRGWFYSEKYAF